MSICCALLSITAWAQQELPLEDFPPEATQANYKDFGGFLLDMGLMKLEPVALPKLDIPAYKPLPDYNKLFQLNKASTFSTVTNYSTSYTNWRTGMSGTLHKASFKLKNGMRINTYGEYNQEGYRQPSNRGGAPWEQDRFRGAFELKSANGNFGFKVEVRQGGRSYP